MVLVFVIQAECTPPEPVPAHRDDHIVIPIDETAPAELLARVLALLSCDPPARGALPRIRGGVIAQEAGKLIALRVTGSALLSSVRR
jgi:hypothetical protein